MRTKHAIKNISISIFSQVIIIILGFISRKIFLDNLGLDYLGVNGVLTNVLSAMVLIEGGIGISIVYNLYKPLAENNEEQIIALVQLYKKAYRVLAIIIFVICIGIYPFLGILLKTDKEIQGLNFVYWLFVAKSVFTYIYAYKWALINADQRGYILAKNNIIFQVISLIGKIAILKLTQNYILFLIIDFGVFIIQNIVNSNVVNKRYSYIKTKKVYTIEKDVRFNIVKNVKAMFIQNIGSYIIFSTDNILISSMISVATVGLYDNYNLIVSQLATLLNPILGGIGAGVGNLIATEDKGRTYFIFNITTLVAFWIYSFSVIFLFNLLEPFITLMFGRGLLLDKLTFIIVLLNFYITGLRNVINTFKSKAGLFSEDKYATLIEGAMNLVLSLMFIKIIGLAGVFLGTTVSYLLLSFWNQPRIVFKKFFNKNMGEYFIKYFIYMILGGVVLIVTTVVINLLVTGTGLLALVAKGIICLIIPNLFYLALFYKTEEFKYLIDVIKVNLVSIREKMGNKVITN